MIYDVLRGVTVKILAPVDVSILYSKIAIKDKISVITNLTDKAMGLSDNRYREKN